VKPGEWAVIAQAVGLAGGSAILAVLIRGRLDRNSLVAVAALVITGLGVFNLAQGIHAQIAQSAAVRTTWVDNAAGRAKCVADASDTQWLPLVGAARARLHEGDHWAVVGGPQVDLACLQLQLLPALGVDAHDRRATVLISFGRVPRQYKELPSQPVGEGALVTRAAGGG
jgi:hypothetical protein